MIYGREEIEAKSYFHTTPSIWLFTQINDLRCENRLNSATGLCEMGNLPDSEQLERKVMTLPLTVSPRYDWQVAQQAILSKGSFSSQASLCDLQQSCGSTETQHHGAAFTLSPSLPHKNYCTFSAFTFSNFCLLLQLIAPLISHAFSWSDLTCNAWWDRMNIIEETNYSHAEGLDELASLAQRQVCWMCCIPYTWSQQPT